MKYIFRRIIYISIIVFWQISNTQAQVISPYLTEVDYNVDVDYLNGESVIFLHNQVMIDTIGSVNSTESPAVVGNIRGAVVDGYHKDGDGLRYFSFDADTLVNGIQVLKSDIIQCNDNLCNSFDFFFNAFNQSLQGININAFTLDPVNGELIFSIESDAVIAGASYLAADLIRFNGTNYSLAYDSISDTFSRYKNIDALTLLPNNYYIVSFANESVFHEVFEYNLATGQWATAYTPLSFGNNFNGMNIVSLMGFENDLIFKNGFD